MKDYTPIKKMSLNILRLVSMAFALLLFLLPPFAQSADDSSDRPAWAGNQGKDGKPGRGNNQPGVSKGDLYGDLLIIVRNDNGEPVLYTWDWVDELDATIYKPAQDDNGCFQPIANEQALDPITGEPLPALPEEFQMLIPLNSDCEIVESLEGYEGYDFASYGEEVDFGRLSVARSPTDVIEASYNEAMSNINNALSIRTDPAGRIEVEVEAGVFKTIDSPLENLALYKKLMLNGYLPELDLTDEQLGGLRHLAGNGVETLSLEDLNMAASFLAGAGDKFGYITLDLVININTILGINDVNGNNLNLNENGYFNFTAYSYYRDVAYGGKQVGLLLPGVVPAEPDEYGIIYPVEVSTLSYQVVPLLDIPSNPQAFTADQVNTDYARGFTQAADDSLRVINYIHNWGLPDLPDGLEWPELDIEE
ncbi:hypothetical protein [Vibrio sp. EA2]|uniref:hypothetical protein n=1 Tax=Vibrio sp. EA2 TaxID=3079860 RepID=UPI00294AF534|nr:hypothetical protein [Vibrio sp. EA2]